jgi:hypothetical protein
MFAGERKHGMIWIEARIDVVWKSVMVEMVDNRQDDAPI